MPGLSGLKLSGILSGEFIYLLPLIVVAVSFLFIIEVNGIKRAGRFIDQKIEKKLPNIEGWEHFLDDLGKGKVLNPPVLGAANFSFILLMGVYYLFSAGVSYYKLSRLTWVGSVAYVAIALVIFVIWILEITPFLSYSAENQE